MRPNTDPIPTAIQYARSAREFLVCALAAGEFVKSKAIGGISHIPVMFLFGRCLELTLKSFLLHKQVSVKELSNGRPPGGLGHNLENCAARANLEGLLDIRPLTCAEWILVHVLNEVYVSKKLEYGVGPIMHPALGALEKLNKDLLHKVGLVVGYAHPDLEMWIQNLQNPPRTLI
jgi:hypothetical protein